MPDQYCKDNQYGKRVGRNPMLYGKTGGGGGGLGAEIFVEHPTLRKS